MTARTSEALSRRLTQDNDDDNDDEEFIWLTICSVNLILSEASEHNRSALFRGQRF